MKQITIQSQVDAVNKATKMASISKDSALKFLIDARIIKCTSDDKKTSKVIAKTKK